MGIQGLRDVRPSGGEHEGVSVGGFGLGLE